ncbi:MAG: transporter substrate-binding domain-containing protein [Chloroflexi bacterium]|nr:transporter substrate-binding domain-containing protein [Chloroflexota bacterium]
MLSIIAWISPALIGALTLLAVLVALASGGDRSPALPRNAAADTPSAATGRRSVTHGAGAATMFEQTQDRLDLVRRRGHLVCASSDAIPGFGYLAAGQNAGFDVDLCRAVAAAALGDPNAVEFRISIPTGLGAAVRSGEIDMVARILTATTTRDAPGCRSTPRPAAFRRA